MSKENNGTHESRMQNGDDPHPAHENGGAWPDITETNANGTAAKKPPEQKLQRNNQETPADENRKENHEMREKSCHFPPGNRKVNNASIPASALILLQNFLNFLLQNSGNRHGE